MNERMKRVLKNPAKIFITLGAKGIFSWMKDKTYLKIMFRILVGDSLNLDNPTTFNEKLQWIKLHDRKEIYTKMADKYEAKKYVADIIGKKYIIPTLGVWDKFEDIDFSLLPNSFVLKCTHDSGGLVIVRDKSHFDKSAAKKKINKCLRKNYFWQGREWPYKDIRPRIIAEKYMTDGEDDELKDYKILNFNGQPKLIWVDMGRYKHHVRNLYDLEWNLMDVSINYPVNKAINIEKPERLNEMLEISRILSKDSVFLRTDFYVINEKIYFGELTFTPASGVA